MIYKKRCLKRVFFLLLCLLILTVTAQGTRAELVGHWDFDEMSGTSASDDSGQNNGGTLYGNTGHVAGKIGDGALAFDGDGDYVGVPNADSISITGDITLSAWVNVVDYTSGSLHRGIIGKTLGNQPAPYDFYLRNDALPTFLRGDGYAGHYDGGVGDVEVQTSIWTHVLVAQNGTAAYFYIDGELHGTDTINPSVVANAGTALIIGSRSGLDIFMKGMIDDPAVWDTAITSGEARAIYNLGNETALNYNAKNANDLFQVFAEQLPSVTIGGHTWNKVAEGTLAGDVGDVVSLEGGGFGLVLDSSGAGVATVPEPGMFILLMGAAICFLGRTWQRNK